MPITRPLIGWGEDLVEGLHVIHVIHVIVMPRHTIIHVLWFNHCAEAASRIAHHVDPFSSQGVTKVDVTRLTL
jgi:uncharacterized membrane protein YagU involved in acid resistance